MPWRITSCTTLDDAKREAKRWLKALRANDPDARARLERALPDQPLETPALRDVQHALAREQGFAGWTAFKEHLAARTRPGGNHPVLARYEQMAANLLEAFRTGTPEAMERHWNDTWHRRAWKGMRRYVLADLGRPAEGEQPTADISLEDARWLVARDARFESWQTLSQYVATLPRGARALPAKPIGLYAEGGGDPPEDEPITRDWDEALELLRSGRFSGLHANGQATDEVLERLSRVEQVTSLKLGSSPALTDDGLRHLARMPQLRHLDLGGCAIADQGLAALRELRSLETISLADTRVTDVGIAHLACCDRLRRVDLSWTRTGDGALAALSGRPVLHDLRTGVDVSDAGLARLEAFPVFRTWRGEEPTMALLSGDAGPNYLSLRSRISDAGLATLARLEGLFALNIHDKRMPMTASGIASLRAAPNLGWLAYEADDESMRVIGEMPKLQFLLSQDSNVTDDGWVALSRSRTLRYIWGRDSAALGRRGFAALGCLPSLRALSVNLANVDDAALAGLASFPALRELMPMGVRDEGYQHIGRCTDLESLVLMYCRETTDRATEHVTGLQALRHYFASYTGITDRTPALLARIRSLERIELHGCAGVTNRGIGQLASLPSLRELVLSAMQNADRSVVGLFPPGVRVRWSM